MSGSVRSSAELLWRHQRLLWWLFALNLLLARLSALPVRAALRPLLDHSLQSARLVQGFDLGTLVLVLEQPQVQLRALAPAALAAALLYLLATWLLAGGLVGEFLEDRKPGAGEFFASCGAFFWRMARLSLLSAFPFGALAAAAAALSGYAGHLSSNARPERLGFLVNVAGQLAILLAALLVRLWFDLAQARVVHGEGRKVLRELWKSLKPAFCSGLYWQYLGIAFLAAASTVAGVCLWAFLPHAAIGASFAVLELMTLAQIAARLWMKAASARWVALAVTL